MDTTTTTNNNQQPPEAPPATTTTTTTTGYPPQPPYHHLLQQQQQQLQLFWTFQRQDIEQVNDFKNHQLPLARIKKIMKADEDVRMISAEAPILFAKACELFILELTIRSWLHAEENKRRTLQKNDIAAAITRTDIFDFLVDIVPRDELKDEVAAAATGAGVGVGFGGIIGGLMGPTVAAGGAASGVPYYYPPMGQAAPPPGVMIGRPAATAAGMYVHHQAPPPHPPPSQAWQSVWQTDDASYGSVGGNDQGSVDGQRKGEFQLGTVTTEKFSQRDSNSAPQGDTLMWTIVLQAFATSLHLCFTFELNQIICRYALVGAVGF